MHIAEPDQISPSSQRIGPLQVWLTAHPAQTLGEHTARPLLEQWFKRAPGTLPLRREARGKPRLEGDLQRQGVNWSHSGQALLLATGPNLDVGTDIERLRRRPRALDLAERYFAPQESQALRSLPQSTRDFAFLRLWCAKEAVLKAHGHGISFGLDRLVFAPSHSQASLATGPLQLQSCDKALGDPQDWALHQWQPHPHYLAALAWRALPAA